MLISIQSKLHCVIYLVIRTQSLKACVYISMCIYLQDYLASTFNTHTQNLGYFERFY